MQVHEGWRLDILASLAMQILFAISLLCFLVFFWARIPIARHLRANRLQVSPSPGSSQQLLAAIPFAPVLFHSKSGIKTTSKHS
jgi:hypothetical protein